MNLFERIKNSLISLEEVEDFDIDEFVDNLFERLRLIGINILLFPVVIIRFIRRR